MERNFWWSLLILFVVLVFIGISYYFPEQTGNVIFPRQIDAIDGIEGNGATSSYTKSENYYIDISSVEAKKLIELTPNLIIIDVSSAYELGHLPGAINYYVGDGSLNSAIPFLSFGATYLVYCHIESASRIGAQTLIDAGFTHVFRLEDNYAGWVEQGYPVEK